MDSVIQVSAVLSHEALLVKLVKSSSPKRAQEDRLKNVSKDVTALELYIRTIIII